MHWPGLPGLCEMSAPGPGRNRESPAEDHLLPSATSATVLLPGVLSDDGPGRETAAQRRGCPVRWACPELPSPSSCPQPWEEPWVAMR